MDHMEAAANYSRLWNGSEPGWIVVRHTEDRQTLQVTFSSGGPTVSEVKALHTIAPVLAEMPAADVVATLKGRAEFSLGDFESMAARELRAQCAALGLRIESRGHQAVRHSLINELLKAYLLIEDPIEGKIVAEEAIKQGLPVRHAAI